MPSLIHLVYASVATRDLGPSDLTALLQQSRHDNERAGLTGMLLYSEGSFFQVLEGDAESVDRLYGRIEADPRHRNPIMIIREPIARRCFGDWSMGFSSPGAEELTQTPGLNDFFGTGSCLAALDAGRARKLLDAFARGRWRARISGPTRIAS